MYRPDEQTEDGSDAEKVRVASHQLAQHCLLI